MTSSHRVDHGRARSFQTNLSPNFMVHHHHHHHHHIQTKDNSYRQNESIQSHHVTPVLFPFMGIEMGMEIIYFHSEK